MRFFNFNGEIVVKTQNKLLLMATASLLVFGSAAQAQDAPAADAPVETAETISDSDAQLEFLKAQVDSLQAQIETLTARVGKAEPSWKGAPNWLDKDAGWSFKPKGFAQFDAGYVSTPGPNLSGTAGGTNYNNLGWNMRTRRLVFGAEGSMPGGFNYKVEFNFAQSTVDYEDITLSWQGKGPIQLTVGHMYPLSSLETMTSSRLGSFMERAGFTEAFNYNRRLGLMAAYVDPADRLYLAAGVWGQEINDSTNFSRTAWQGSARAVYSPTWGSTRLHLGVNAQYRKAPRDAQNMRYRVRPFSQTTDQRFIDTNTIAADGDTTVGVEFAAIHGPFHVASEAQKVWVRGYAPGKTFGPNNAAGGSFYNDDASFWGGYAEVGFFLTGETRGYKGAKWDRTKVLKPVGQGGMGAVQLNARLDYVNLNDATGGTGPAPVAPVYVNGGRQTGYQFSVIWNPIDYIRFLAQYSRAHVNGGPRAATVDPTGPAFVLDKSYNVDQFGVRAQVEF
jgi:phosphate-selective porin OprO and OprP